MTPCIGWLADPPCPVHGITHGCRWPEGHTGGHHECICGATCRRQVERHSPPVNRNMKKAIT